MIVKVVDIPPEGLEIEFPLDESVINQRISASESPDYRFLPNAHVKVRLNAEGSTVTVQGKGVCRYVTSCSRCAEETEKDLDVNVHMILKPRPERGPVEAQDEDLHFGFYDEKEINTGSIVEEFIVLSIPYTVLCQPDCLGLCPSCGKNLNTGPCTCPPKEAGDERMAVLRGLKLQ